MKTLWRGVAGCLAAVLARLGFREHLRRAGERATTARRQVDQAGGGSVEDGVAAARRELAELIARARRLAGAAAEAAHDRESEL